VQQHGAQPADLAGGTHPSGIDDHALRLAHRAAAPRSCPAERALPAARDEAP
jgi:hypothetical protein